MKGVGIITTAIVCFINRLDVGDAKTDRPPNRNSSDTNNDDSSNTIGGSCGDGDSDSDSDGNGINMSYSYCDLVHKKRRKKKTRDGAGIRERLTAEIVSNSNVIYSRVPTWAGSGTASVANASSGMNSIV